MRQTSNSPELHDLTGNELCVYFGSEHEEKKWLSAVMLSLCIFEANMKKVAKHELSFGEKTLLKKVESPNFPVICLKIILYFDWRCQIK